MATELELDPATTALVVIDLQAGILARSTEPYPSQAVLARAERLARRFRDTGATVILVRVATSPDGRDGLRPRTDMARPISPGGRPADFAMLAPSLGPEEGDIVVTKRQWGAFYGTDLDLQLRRRGIGTIVLAGISTERGVESTARAAYEHGYQLVVVEDACAALAADDHRHSMTRVFPQIGLVRTTDQVIEGLQAV